MIDYRNISVVVQDPVEHVDNITKKVCDDVRHAHMNQALMIYYPKKNELFVLV